MAAEPTRDVAQENFGARPNADYLQPPPALAVRVEALTDQIGQGMPRGGDEFRLPNRVDREGSRL
jgi:hypothetical protein